MRSTCFVHLLTCVVLAFLTTTWAYWCLDCSTYGGPECEATISCEKDPKGCYRPGFTNFTRDDPNTDWGSFVPPPDGGEGGGGRDSRDNGRGHYVYDDPAYPQATYKYTSPDKNGEVTIDYTKRTGTAVNKGNGWLVFQYSDKVEGDDKTYWFKYKVPPSYVAGGGYKACDFDFRGLILADVAGWWVP